ncbi:adhesion G-protein coupled receptor G5 isoform X2 [Syngnathus scovelli]|uniref:adhesion G-protein coupled receptor G5 isoform X2 n=1 Tax=Syngnathus scovelli TaxID=161590 RepID=UPI0021105679|nr:adhesion G-protein coupled receptor G5 isoform X2 [Syngnathus scovelli]
MRLCSSCPLVWISGFALEVRKISFEACGLWNMMISMFTFNFMMQSSCSSVVRMKWWLLVWLLLFLTRDGEPQNSKDTVRGDNPNLSEVWDEKEGLEKDCNNGDIYQSCKVSGPRRVFGDAECCMTHVNTILDSRKPNIGFQAIERLQQSLEQIEVNETTSLCVGQLVALLLKPGRRRAGLHISASDNHAIAGAAINNSRVNIRLPGDFLSSLSDTMLFCMVTWPRSIWNFTSEELYQNRLLGLSVRGKNISGLRERVNITVNTVTVNETQSPRCVFLNFSTKSFSSSGCWTIWEPGQTDVTCSCDHLTYFGILLVSAPLSDTDEAVLTYLSVIGCSLSLVALVITLLLFVVKRKLHEDVSMKVHANLAVALILLNAHFLSSHAAASSSDSTCFYVALALHYSLLATFSWMALESFHLYLLLVRVFNIYIRRYMLKLGLAGWSLPAAIVTVAAFTEPGAYGRVALNIADPNGTQICYLRNSALKMASTLGLFAVVFAFNLVMLLVTVQRLFGFPHRKRFGQGERGRAKQNISTLLGVSTLLGITWGLVFFSFGHLSTVGQYLFCILNSLQGFFIFLWFVLSWRKSGPSTASSKTPSSSS